MRSLIQSNTPSRFPTKNLIIAKCKAIADTNYHRRKSYKSCNIYKDIWWCWLFNNSEVYRSRRYSHRKRLWSSLPRFWWAQQITRKLSNGINFFCYCGYHDHIVLSHDIWMVDVMTLNMLHICHRKVYNGHYGDNSRLGRLMIQAWVNLCDIFDWICHIFQEEHFRNEGLGVSITLIQNDNLTQIPVELNWMGNGTFGTKHISTRWHYANYIFFKSEESGCTTSDSKLYLKVNITNTMLLTLLLWKEMMYF